MKRLLALLLIAPFSAVAQTPPWNHNTLTWTPPTHYEDGTPILGGLQRYELYVQFNDGEWKALNLALPGTSTSRLHIVEIAGKYCYRLVAVSRDVPSFPSDPPACKVNVAPRPNPPTALSAQ